MDLGNRILQRRKELGMTQAELAEKMFVTRQTISRWEAGIVYPDVQKVVELAKILCVSCDYLLLDKDGNAYLEVAQGNAEQDSSGESAQPIEKETKQGTSSAVTRLFETLKGKKIRLTFFEDEEDMDLLGETCVITGFHGNWVEIEHETKKETLKKFLSISSILSVEILQ